MIDTQVAGSAGWWFDTLAKELASRAPRIAALSAYLDGNAPLPEGAEGFREAYRAFQKKGRSNFPEIIVQAPQERMVVGGFRTDGELKAEADRIWRVNEMATTSTDVHGDFLGLGEGYAIVGPAESTALSWLPWSRKDKTPVITYEDPRYVITAHNPLLPTQAVAGLKLYHDDVAGKDVAFVYLPGRVYRAERNAPTDQTSSTAPSYTSPAGFDWVSETKLPAPVVPVVRFRNYKGRGEFETHTDLIDRINYMVLQRLVITAMQAFRQRATKGTLDETDEGGNPIDYGAIFKPGPGALWQLPDGVDLWESSVTDINPLLTAVKDDIRDLSALTRTPLPMLLPDAQNQSAEGATAGREGLVWKTQDRIQRASYGWNTVMRTALMFAGNGDVNVETEWLDPERRSLAERADAASKLVPAGVPFKTIMTDVMQFPPDKVERMEQERITDSFLASMTTPTQPTVAAAENNGV